MFSFNHVTSITVTADEYAKLSPEQQAKCELKSDKKSYYMRIGTTMSLPDDNESDIEGLVEFVETLPGGDVEMTFGDKKITYPTWFKYLVVGWKLEVNQNVQADYRSGSKTEQRAATISWYCTGSPERTQEFMQKAIAASTPTLAKAKDAWLDALTVERLAGKVL